MAHEPRGDCPHVRVDHASRSRRTAWGWPTGTPLTNTVLASCPGSGELELAALTASSAHRPRSDLNRRTLTETPLTGASSWLPVRHGVRSPQRNARRLGPGGCARDDSNIWYVQGHCCYRLSSLAGTALARCVLWDTSRFAPNSRTSLRIPPIAIRLGPRRWRRKPAWPRNGDQRSGTAMAARSG